MDMKQTESFESAYLKHQVEDNYARFKIIPYITGIIGLLFIIKNLSYQAEGVAGAQSNNFLILWMFLVAVSVAFRIYLPKIEQAKSLIHLDFFIFVFANIMCLTAATLTALDSINSSDFTAYAFTILGTATAYRTSVFNYLLLMVVTFLYFNLFYFVVLDCEFSIGFLLPIIALSTISVFIAASLENNREKMVHLSSQLEIMNLKLKDESIKDPLTTLYNRRFLNDFLHREIDEYKRTATPLCIAICDIDYFKKVNDTLGHMVGDDCLVEFSKLILENCRTTDVPIRFGGEEFVIVMPRTNLDAAIKVVERIRKATEEKAFPSIPWPITVSVGITNIHSEDNFDILLDRADCLLYQAKKSGRNCVISPES